MQEEVKLTPDKRRSKPGGQTIDLPYPALYRLRSRLAMPWRS